MRLILNSLDSVRRETGATVIAVHHTNANGGRECGSTVVRSGMDVMMEGLCRNISCHEKTFLQLNNLKRVGYSGKNGTI